MCKKENEYKVRLRKWDWDCLGRGTREYSEGTAIPTVHQKGMVRCLLVIIFP